MEGIDRAKLKDKILSFLMQDTYHTYPIDTLWESLGKPCSMLDFKTITDEMVHYGANYFLIVSNGTYDSFGQNDYTGDFLDSGGFTKEYEIEVEIMRKQVQNATRDLKLQELQEENLILNNKLSKQKLKTHWVPVIISLLGIFIAFGTFIWSIYKPSDNFIPFDVSKRLDTIESTQEKLIKGFIKENDSLKNELHKAEMIITIYEEEN